MRVVLQRVLSASVKVDGDTVGAIEAGLLLLVGVAPDDDEPLTRRIAVKCAEMRVFSDDEGKFNLSLLDTGGQALVVSQFTLLGDVRRGRRPSFTGAAPPEHAAPLVDAFVSELRRLDIAVETGRFGAKMAVESVNDGPVTILIDSDELDRLRRG